MIISILECRPDGTQTIEETEVPETWFTSVPPSEESSVTEE